MDAFTRRIDPEDSFDIGDDMSNNSFDLNSSSMSSSSSSLSFGVHSPGGDSSSGDVNEGADIRRQTPRREEVTSSEQQSLPESYNKYRRRPLYEAPDFVRRLNVFEEVDVGGKVTFECQVRAFPRPIIKWYKDDVEIPSTSWSSGTGIDAAVAAGSRVQSEDLTGVDVSSEGLLRLVVSDACKADEGAYRCKAENEEGVAATTGYLSVTGVPGVPSGNQSSGSNGQQQQQQPSPGRVNAVSAPPLLRAITEQQSMEEREAAAYVELQDDEIDDYDDDGAAQSVPDVPILSATNGDWLNYVDYLQKTIGDNDASRHHQQQQQRADTGSGSDTSCELDDVIDTGANELRIVEHDTVVACRQPTTKTGRGEDSAAPHVNVVVVESDNPDEATVAASVIGIVAVGGSESEMTNAATAPLDVNEERQQEWPSHLVAGPVYPSAERGDGGQIVPPSMSLQQRTLADVQQSSRGFGDTGIIALHDQSAVLQSAASRGVDVVVVDPDNIVPQMNVAVQSELQQQQQQTPAVATVGEKQQKQQQQQQRAGISPLSIFRREAVAANDRETPSRAPPESEVDDVFVSDGNTAAAGEAKTPTSSSNRSFSLGGLLQEILPRGCPAAAKQSAGPPVVQADQSQGIADVEKETAAVQLRHRRADVELSWSMLVDWYMGWFEPPWLFYVCLAVLLTLASTATEADPAEVLIVSLVMSIVFFLLFPPTSTSSSEMSSSLTAVSASQL